MRSAPARQRLRAGLAVLLGALVLTWGAIVELGLLWLCTIDDTSEPHGCPYAVWPLVVVAIAALGSAVIVFLVARGARAFEAAVAFVAAVALLGALGWLLDGLTN